MVNICKTGYEFALRKDLKLLCWATAKGIYLCVALCFCHYSESVIGELLLGAIKGLILGSRKQVIFKNSRSLASAFPDAACPFIFLISLWPASILQIWILSHPLTGRETRVRNVFLLSSCTNYFALLPLQVLHRLFIMSSSRVCQSGCCLESSYYQQENRAVWCCPVLLFDAWLSWYYRNVGEVLVLSVDLGLGAFGIIWKADFLSPGDHRSGSLSGILYFLETDDVSHLAFWIIGNDWAPDIESSS